MFLSGLCQNSHHSLTELIALVVIPFSSSLYPLFSSNLLSSHLPFQSGSSWIYISEPLKEGGRWRDGEKKTERDRESEREKRASNQERKWGWGKQKKKNRDGGRVSNYRTPGVFKAPLLSHPSWEREKQQKEEEEQRKTRVQALVQVRQQAPVIHITQTQIHSN